MNDKSLHELVTEQNLRQATTRKAEDKRLKNHSTSGLETFNLAVRFAVTTGIRQQGADERLCRALDATLTILTHETCLNVWMYGWMDGCACGKID
jgi:hypothetical protein